MADIDIRKGNDKDVPLQIKDGQAILNLTGATVELMVKEDMADADGVAIITKISDTPAELTITSAATGKIEVHFVPADTSTITAKNYFYDIRVITATNKEYNTEAANFVVEEVVNQL